MKMQYNLPCDIAQTLNIIGDKWSLLILHRIFIGYETYNEMKDKLEGIPTNLLSERLKTMEGDGLLERNLYQDHPPRYKYTLTEKGMDLVHVFNSLMIWGQKHLNTCHNQVAHKGCKGTIEHKYYCNVCAKNVDINQLEIIDPN